MDLSGSTAIFEDLGDETATKLVHKITHDLATHFEKMGGRVVKLLGDGVMVLFDRPQQAVYACNYLANAIIKLDEKVSQKLLTDRISVRAGVDYGTLIEFENDVYGDIVNVASRIMTHARPGELMMTASVHEHLNAELKKKCRHLGNIYLKGKSHPQVIYGMNITYEKLSEESSDQHTQDTLIASLKKSTWGDTRADNYIHLDYQGEQFFFSTEELPITIGRSLESDLVVPDARVSRSHVRIDWFASQFYITDISINGTMVQYGGDKIGEPFPVLIRRQRSTLIRSGYILLGVLDRQMLALQDETQLPPILRFQVE